MSFNVDEHSSEGEGVHVEATSMPGSRPPSRPPSIGPPSPAASGTGSAAPAFDVPAAFLDPGADLLLRSSDGVLFKVHKAILSAGSTFFRDMFLHPQPPDSEPAIESPLPCDEPATTITGWLYHLYPIVPPENFTVEELCAVAVAADKWGMEEVMRQVLAKLTSPQILDCRPLMVYKLACRLDKKDLKDLSATRLVQLYDPMDVALRQDLDGLSARQMVYLYDLRVSWLVHCQHALDVCLPIECSHGLGIEYFDNWRAKLSDKLTHSPRVEVIPDPVHSIFNLGSESYCDWACARSMGGLSQLRETLSAPWSLE